MATAAVSWWLRGVRQGLQEASAGPVDLRVADGAIAEIRAHRPQEAVHAGDVDGRGLLVFPGLVNAHAHSNESFESGAYAGGPLETWLALSYPPLGDADVAPRVHYLRAMHLARQSLRSGVTALHDDFLNPGGDAEALAQVLAAYRDAGLRARVAVTCVDRGYLDGLPGARKACPPHLAAALDARAPRPLAAQRDFFETALRRHGAQAAARVGLSLGPRGPQRCTAALLRLVAELSAQHGVPVQMHVLETRVQALSAAERHGHSFVQCLDEAGLLGPALALNHAVWLTAADVARIAERGAHVVHNPLSNFKLSSGLCPVRHLLAAGVPLGLGTDGAATSDSVDFFDTLRFAALVHQLDAQGQETLPAPTAAQVLQMATRGGAASMGGAGRFGELAVGQRADFCLVNARDAALVPLNDAPRQLCFAATSRCVHSVYVDGEAVFAQGRCLRLDEAALDAEIAEAAERFRHERLARQGRDDAGLLALVRGVTAQAARQAPAFKTLNQLQLR
jgi:5-methylthioadenosine/S-adenosylhomocysteine deaminase